MKTIVLLGTLDTKGQEYEYVRQHNEAVNRLDFIEGREEITADYAPGEVINLTQHDGSVMRLRKLAAEHDPTDRVKAMNFVQEHASKGEVVTGLLYVDPSAVDMHEHLNTVATPLNQLSAKELCPGSAALDKINASLR